MLPMNCGARDKHQACILTFAPRHGTNEVSAVNEFVESAVVFGARIAARKHEADVDEPGRNRGASSSQEYLP